MITGGHHSPRNDGADDAGDPLGLRREGAGLAAAAAAADRRGRDLSRQQEDGGADPQPERRVLRVDALVAINQYLIWLHA